jgi:hypothetical protein
MPTPKPNNKPTSKNHGSVPSQLSTARPAQKPKITEVANSTPMVPTNAKARKGPFLSCFNYGTPPVFRFYTLPVFPKKYDKKHQFSQEKVRNNRHNYV